jgi:hypothetical protein
MQDMSLTHDWRTAQAGDVQDMNCGRMQDNEVGEEQSVSYQNNDLQGRRGVPVDDIHIHGSPGRKETNNGLFPVG